MPKIIVISSYPEKNLVHGNKTVGVASYTKNTLLAVKKEQPDVDITVLAEKLQNSETNYTDNENIKVKRVWERSKISSFKNILLEVIKSDSKKVFIAFEMFMMGGFFHASLFIVLFYIFKLFGKQNIVVVHQVVGDVSSFETNPLKRIAFSILRKLFYPYLLGGASKVIVFEEELKIRLGNKSKTVVIPHAVENFTPLTKTEARKHLKLDQNRKYLLYFGFLSPYKGIDAFMSAMNLPADTTLIVAGGPNPNHVGEPHYDEFINRVNSLAKEKGSIITGFLLEEEIKYYYSASDILVLPYKTFMSSSGPLGIAFTYEKPFLLSEPLKPYFKTKDFKSALESTSMQPEDFLFSFDQNSINQRLNQIDSISEQYIKFSKILKKSRSWGKLAKDYLNIINE